MNEYYTYNFFKKSKNINKFNILKGFFWLKGIHQEYSFT